MENSMFSHRPEMNMMKQLFYFINQCEKSLLLVMAFDCFFGIGTASFTYLALRLWHSNACFFLIPGWTVIIYLFGYDYVLFSRLEAIEYLYEKNSSPEIDIFFGLLVLFGNLWMASEVFAFKLKKCSVCSGAFKQYVNMTDMYQHFCVCVCLYHGCRRMAKDCPVCRSGTLKISVEENYSFHKLFLVLPFIQLIFQYIPFFCKYQQEFNMENNLLSVFETIHNVIKFGRAIGALLFCLVIFRCLKDFVINFSLKNVFLTSIIYPWCHFVSTCDVIMLATSAFDCAFGIGAYNFTYMLFCALKQSLAFVILIPGWIVVLYVLGYKYFLERIQGNIESSLFLLNSEYSEEYPNHKDKAGPTDQVFDIKLSLAIMLCNFYMASKLFEKKFEPFSKHLWKCQLLLTVPFIQVASQFLGLCKYGLEPSDHPIENASGECLTINTFIIKLLDQNLFVLQALLGDLGFDSDIFYWGDPPIKYCILFTVIALNTLCLFVGLMIFLILISRILHKLGINLPLPWNLQLGINFRLPLNLSLGSISRFPRDMFASICFNGPRHDPYIRPNLNLEKNDYRPEHHISANAEGKEQVKPNEKESIISVLKEFQSETINQQKKSENELKEGLKKLLQSQLDEKLVTLESELKRSQVQQFADMKNQQKLFLQQIQNNSKKKEGLNSIFDEIKEDSIRNFDHQSKRTDKQYEGLRKQCDEMKTTITNQTRQIGILHNLVLELKNSDGESDAAKAQGPQLENSDETLYSRECKICYDKELKVALRNCGHLLCEDCAKKYPRKCPTCSKVIIGTQIIFLP